MKHWGWIRRGGHIVAVTIAERVTHDDEPDRENWEWLDSRGLRARARRSNRACYSRAWTRYLDEWGQNVYTSGAIE